jgi:predicted RNA binding protein YcfA (HicA-like mRNA interferase family)
VRKYKVKEIIKLLLDDGWYLCKRTGTSHRQFKHETKKGRVTVNGKLSDTLGEELTHSIWKQAGWNK